MEKELSSLYDHRFPDTRPALLDWKGRWETMRRMNEDEKGPLQRLPVAHFTAPFRTHAGGSLREIYTTSERV